MKVTFKELAESLASSLNNPKNRGALTRAGAHANALAANDLARCLFRLATGGLEIPATASLEASGLYLAQDHLLNVLWNALHDLRAESNFQATDTKVSNAESEREIGW